MIHSSQVRHVGSMCSCAPNLDKIPSGYFSVAAISFDDQAQSVLARQAGSFGGGNLATSDAYLAMCGLVGPLGQNQSSI